MKNLISELYCLKPTEFQKSTSNDFFVCSVRKLYYWKKEIIVEVKPWNHNSYVQEDIKEIRAMRNLPVWVLF